MRRLVVVIAGTIALAACNNIASPAIVSAYEYRRLEFNRAGVAETLTFHWPRSSLPVRIWVPDTAAIAKFVPVAIDRWQSALLYGEYRATMVSDSNQADVIFLNRLPNDFLGPQLPAFAAQCTGITDGPDIDTHTWPLPIHIYVFPNASGVIANLDTCYSITVTHELGHSLGILNHSPISTDVMYANPTFDGITVDDRETAAVVYHVPANIAPGKRR